MRIVRTAIAPMMVIYRECLKNQAVSVGGHAVDGCRVFTASSQEGNGVYACAACDCHRNFHRREVRPSPPPPSPAAPSASAT